MRIPSLGNSERVLLVLLFEIVLIPSQAQGQLIERPDATFSLSRSKLYQWRQRFVRNRVNFQSWTAEAASSSPPRGSIMTMRQPTPERLSRWFWGGGANDKLSAFNHESVGMTNPFLRIQVEQQPSAVAVPVVSITSPSQEQEWWPETASDKEQLQQDKWRVLCVRRRVGCGLDCYQRVRDAALAWEFVSLRGDKGVLSVRPVSDTRRPKKQPRFGNGHDYTVHPFVENNAWSPIQSNQVHQIWSGPGRRLVSFTAARIWPGWALYSLNPVHVVYDLVDQAGGRGTLYTSTAFATGKRHWLRGEERVTVALRGNGAVSVEILSFSKPAKSCMGALVWPVIGKMQRRFFQEQMNAFERVASHQSAALDAAAAHPARNQHLVAL